MKQMKYKSGEKRHKEEAGDGEAVKKVRTAECVDATNRKLAQINLLHNEWRALGGGGISGFEFFLIGVLKAGFMTEMCICPYKDGGCK